MAKEYSNINQQIFQHFFQAGGQSSDLYAEVTALPPGTFRFGSHPLELRSSTGQPRELIPPAHGYYISPKTGQRVNYTIVPDAKMHIYASPEECASGKLSTKTVQAHKYYLQVYFQQYQQSQISYQQAKLQLTLNPTRESVFATQNAYRKMLKNLILLKMFSTKTVNVICPPPAKSFTEVIR